MHDCKPKPKSRLFQWLTIIGAYLKLEHAVQHK